MQGQGGWGGRDAYECAVSEQLDVVLLAHICHAVEGPCVNQRELCVCKPKIEPSEIDSMNYFFFILVWVVRPSEMKGDGQGKGRATEIRWKEERRRTTYLDLVGDDGTRTELRADLVCPDRIKVYETESLDVSVALHVLEVAQSGHITLIGVVLPIKLHGDWAFEFQKKKRGRVCVCVCGEVACVSVGQRQIDGKA